jgi:hypothetical protein
MSVVGLSWFRFSWQMEYVTFPILTFLFESFSFYTWRGRFSFKLSRHYKVHFPTERRFHCHEVGCDRNGKNGYYRRDKLYDHQRKIYAN